MTSKSWYMHNSCRKSIRRFVIAFESINVLTIYYSVKRSCVAPTPRSYTSDSSIFKTAPVIWILPKHFHLLHFFRDWDFTEVKKRKRRKSFEEFGPTCFLNLNLFMAGPLRHRWGRRRLFEARELDEDHVTESAVFDIRVSSHDESESNSEEVQSETD